MTKHRKARLGKRAEQEAAGGPAEPAEPVFQGFKKGQKVWVHNSDGSTTPAIYVGEGESSTFFGGPPMVYVVIEGADEGAAVELDRVTAR